MPRYSLPASSPTVGVKLIVLGFLVGSIMLVPLAISLPLTWMLHVPSAPLTTVIFLASSSLDLLPLFSRATTLQVPTYACRSFLIALSLALSPAQALVRTNTATTDNAQSLFMETSRGNRADGNHGETP